MTQAALLENLEGKGTLVVKYVSGKKFLIYPHSLLYHNSQKYVHGLK